MKKKLCHFPSYGCLYTWQVLSLDSPVLSSSITHALGEEAEESTGRGRGKKGRAEGERKGEGSGRRKVERVRKGGRGRGREEVEKGNL